MESLILEAYLLTIAVKKNILIINKSCKLSFYGVGLTIGKSCSIFTGLFD